MKRLARGGCVIAASDAGDADARLRRVIDRAMLFRHWSSAWTQVAEDRHRLNAAEQPVGSMMLCEPLLGVSSSGSGGIAAHGRAYRSRLHAEDAKLVDDAEADVRLDQKRAAYLALLVAPAARICDQSLSSEASSRNCAASAIPRNCSSGPATLPFAIDFLVFWWKNSASGLTIGDPANGHQMYSSIPMFGRIVVSVFGIAGVFQSRDQVSRRTGDD